VISDQDVARYREQGYIVVPDVVDRVTLARIHAWVDEIIAKSKGVTQHTDVYDLEPIHTPQNPCVRRIKTPHKLHPMFMELVKSPNMLAILKKLLGPNVRLHGTKLNMKLPQVGSPVEWHQDWAFYPHTNDDILAVGVMLNDVAIENGPMLVVPGSHKGPTYDHHADGRFCGAIDAEKVRLPYDDAIAATGPAGSCSFHHVRLVHGSAMNTSLLPRRLLLFECAAADAWPLVNFRDLDEFDSRMICGEPTIEPRVTSAPIRMPLPPALNQGSIYENQTATGRRYFDAGGKARAAT
jgi:ectoine hydroxylase-related dioxygenase (phytanoyl-CoA dioxygenase family)